MRITLSQLCLILGVGYGIPSLFGILKPGAAAAWLRRFPRHVPWGVALILLGTAWFEYILANEQLSDFAHWKPYLQILFAASGIGACFFLQDFLSVRGLAVLMMLGSVAILDIQRWHSHSAKNVVTLWAYVIGTLGMWYIIQPWRARNWISWNTETETRLRTGCIVRLLFSIGIVGLGLTVLR